MAGVSVLVGAPLGGDAARLGSAGVGATGGVGCTGSCGVKVGVTGKVLTKRTPSTVGARGVATGWVGGRGLLTVLLGGQPRVGGQLPLAGPLVLPEGGALLLLVLVVGTVLPVPGGQAKVGGQAVVRPAPPCVLEETGVLLPVGRAPTTMLLLFAGRRGICTNAGGTVNLGAGAGGTVLACAASVQQHANKHTPSRMRGLAGLG